MGIMGKIEELYLMKYKTIYENHLGNIEENIMTLMTKVYL
jgi:hypothetical protein